MKRVAKVALLFFALVGGMPYGNSDLWAQQKSSALAQQIQGGWILVSIYNVEQDGRKIDIYGTNPRGSMILTPDGRFSIILMRASLPKFASNSRVKGTAQENQAVVQGSSALFGSYSVASEADNTVNLLIEGSTFPNWDGEVQKRVMTVVGDEMKVSIPTAMVGGTSYVIWKRGK
jgi:hypothetical protein